MTAKQKTEQSKPLHAGSVSVGGNTYKAYPVELVRFPPTSPQDLYGKNGASSVSSNQGAAKRSMHTIDFLPDMNQFRIVFYGNGTKLVDMVPVHRVNGWTPFKAGESYTVPGAQA